MTICDQLDANGDQSHAEWVFRRGRHGTVLKAVNLVAKLFE
jgi:hypothetical protein